MSVHLAPKGTYPNNLAEAMRKHNKLSDSVAFKANLSRTMFTSLLHGQRKLNPTWARNLAKAIECEPKELFVQSSDVVDVSNIDVVYEKQKVTWSLVNSDIDMLIELVERELQFMQSTNRNIVAGNLTTIIAKLQSQRNTAVQTSIQVPSQRIDKSKQTSNTKTKVSVVAKLSRPWTPDDLADALSALRNGMTNEEVAGATDRPIKDITTTKMMFSWMWLNNQPTEPSKSQVLKKLENIRPDVRKSMFESAGV